jgi:hypothetical protein
MNSFVTDFNDKVNEINKYFHFVWLIDNLRKINNLENISPKKILEADTDTVKYELKSILDFDNSYKIDSELVKILKANCYLILYNLVEGAITSGINALFVAISSKQKNYKEFKTEIQQVWIKYKKYSHETFQTKRIEESAKFFVDTMEKIFNEKVEILPKTIGKENRVVTDYEAYLKEIGKNEISGNLDADRIRKLSKLYGFPEYVTSKEMHSLLKVKNKRNSLAHGRTNFSEEGRIPIEELIIMKDEVVNYIGNVLNIFEQHIQNEQYIR